MQWPLTWITAASWRLTTSSVCPASRSASVSPTQTIGVMPLASAAAVLAATSLVGLAVVLAPLRMADDRVAHAEVLQHRRRLLAGEGALRLRRDVLRAQRDRRARHQRLHLRQVRRRHAHRDVARRRAHARQQGLQQRLVGSQAAVHLPVACDQLLLGRHVCVVHQVSTILPMCWFDSIRACACAAPLGSPAAAKRAVDDRLDRAALEQRPDLLAQRLGDRALEGDRPRPQRRAGDRQAPAQHQAGVDLALTPPCTAMITSRPSSARQSISRAT